MVGIVGLYHFCTGYRMFFTIFLLILIIYLINKVSTVRVRSVRCLIGKTAIVTGGTSGIGYQVCLNLASRGCKVIIADKTDGTESVKQIINKTKNANITSMKLDLANFQSVRDFANRIKESEDRIDILINNAGIGGSSGLTQDGYNEIIQVNYLGPFLLTHLLIDLLKKSSPSRIIFTSSVGAFFGDFYEENKWTEDLCEKNNPYNSSKLATIIASDIFAKKLKNYGVTSNSLHPGLIRTSIVFPVDSISGMVFLVGSYFLIGKSIPDGAETTTYLAVAEEVENVTGQFFCNCKPFIKPTKAYSDHLLCEKIWEESEKCVKLQPHEKL